MKASLSSAYCLLVMSSALSGEILMNLDGAVGAALDRPFMEDVELRMARMRLEMLEASNNRRFEITPQIGLLALTNPVAFAASTGASMIWKQNPVPPLTLLDARLDVVAAEIEVGRRKFAREAEVSRRFYEASETRHLWERVCEAAHQVEDGAARMEGRFRAALITRAELLRQQQQTIRKQAECLRQNHQHQIASVRLASVVGASVAQLQIQDEPQLSASKTFPLRPVDSLMNVALTHRAQPAGLRDRLVTLRRQIEAAHEPRGLQAALRFSRFGSPGLTDRMNSWTSGTWFQPEVSLRIGFGKQNPFAIEKRLLLLKLQRLEQSLAELETEIRAEVSEIRLRHEAAAAEIPSARQALAIAKEYRHVIEARRSAGLETADQLEAAEGEVQQAELRVVHLQHSARSHFAAMLSMCGLRSQPYSEGQLLLTQNEAR